MNFLHIPFLLEDLGRGYFQNWPPWWLIVVKNLSAIPGDMGSIPDLGRSPGEGNDNPLHYSCLRIPMNRGAWQAIVLGVTKIQTRLSNNNSQDQSCTHKGQTDLAQVNIRRKLVNCSDAQKT